MRETVEFKESQTVDTDTYKLRLSQFNSTAFVYSLHKNHCSIVHTSTSSIVTKGVLLSEEASILH